MRVPVADKLREQWSPEQICQALVIEFPDDEDMRVSAETIYQAIYLQARGGLRREVADRAIPGHWEGDLIVGTRNESAIVTLVERSTRYVMLGHLPGGHTTEEVRDVLVPLIQTLPAHLRGSLTWDQGCEMAAHKQFSIATGVPVYFCDPHAPWQRGSNENTNGLLRQYFPKGTHAKRSTGQHQPSEFLGDVFGVFGVVNVQVLRGPQESAVQQSVARQRIQGLSAPPDSSKTTGVLGTTTEQPNSKNEPKPQ